MAPSPGPGGETATVRRFRSEDEPRVLQLLQSAFGAWPHGTDGVSPAEFFAWKHRASPFGESTMLVAEVDETLAGFLALMPWRLRLGRQVHETIRGVDLAVDPAVHRRGVSMSLIGMARSQFSDVVVLSWSNPNERSRGGSIKSGRQEVSGVRRFVGLGGARWRTLGRLARPAVGGNADQAQAGESAAELLEDQEMVARLLSSSRPAHGLICTAVDASFLRWRYGWSETYRATLVASAGHVGMAIFRVQLHGRLSVAHVCELFVPGDDPRLARRLVRAVRRAAATDLLLVAMASEARAARCGLVRSRRGSAITVNTLCEGLAPDPTQPASWALSLGDLEVI